MVPDTDNEMSVGPGKYDSFASFIRKETKARGVILIINEGFLGSGFSCQLSLEATLAMPRILRDMADQIEADMKQGKL
jgi:hypothetical protein